MNNFEFAPEHESQAVQKPHSMHEEAYCAEDYLAANAWEPEETAANPDAVEDAITTLATATIRREGNRVTGTLPNDVIINIGEFGADRIRIRQNIGFTDQSTPGCIHLTNISGLQVDPGPALPWINVTAIRVTPTQMTVTITGGVQLTFDLPEGAYVNIRQTLYDAQIIRIMQ